MKNITIEAYKIVDAVLENQNSSSIDLILATERSIADQIPYSHHKDKILEACNIPNITGDTLDKLDKDYSKVSEEVEAIEYLFTKRQLAYLLSLAQRQLENLQSHLKNLSE